MNRYFASSSDQVLIFYEIHTDDCSFRNGAYGIFCNIYLSIESDLCSPLVTLTFGFLALNNIRQSKRKIRPLAITSTTWPSPLSRISKRDAQISKMLFNQICLWILLNILNPCYLFY
ncbi:unnamed protein product [Rotaria socialis]|uniref:Uncharacterized protein n=1 Tax=Rotaria socialis TaxID=392032 RepID=A0A818ZBP5_9BILA|nr:unnamed protein product [Rotaria socialis]CAF3766247.1 unnamed protein product [Rotaria socialis]